MNGASAGVVPVRETHDESIIAYFSDGFTMDFIRGETIINGVDDPPGVFLIKEGFVKAYSVSKAGQGNLLLIHEAGDVIPLPWALDGAHTTGLYYEALTDVTAIRSSKDTLRTAMGKNTWLAQEILKQAVNIISTYTQRIQTLEFRSARGRIISELMHLTERFGKIHGSGSIIDAPITHQDIADSINMSRETASRALEELTKEGLIGQDDHLFTIIDLHKLQEALS
ncbi:MAG TPA: Crp/Fnr family transcriptional regulator [Patescibacteria group bacterium]|jgi:CRP/FNR family transcriptional regulator|nr:Crp/Fnr family transcriptional regulator [Patescibacteria group bacterium]